MNAAASVGAAARLVLMVVDAYRSKQPSEPFRDLTESAGARQRRNELQRKWDETVMLYQRTYPNGTIVNFHAGAPTRAECIRAEIATVQRFLDETPTTELVQRESWDSRLSALNQELDEATR